MLTYELLVVWTPLMLSCRYSNTDSNIETVKLLLDSKADINFTTYDKWTPLMLSCRFSTCDSNTDTVKLLLDNKADINLQSDSGASALTLSCDHINKNLITIKVLLNYGADVRDSNLLQMLYTKSSLEVCATIISLLI